MEKWGNYAHLEEITNELFLKKKPNLHREGPYLEVCEKIAVILERVRVGIDLEF